MWQGYFGETKFSLEKNDEATLKECWIFENQHAIAEHVIETEHEINWCLGRRENKIP